MNWQNFRDRYPASLLAAAVVVVGLTALFAPEFVRVQVDPQGATPFLADFRSHFWQQGRVLLTSGLPVAGFYYSAFAGLFFAPLALLSVNLAASVWLATMIGLVAGLSVLLYRWLSPRSVPVAALALAASVPLLHDLRWGQVSLLILVLSVAGFQCHGRRPWLAAGLLGAAIALKLYPAVLLVHFALRRDFGMIVRCLVVVMALMLLPALWIGMDGVAIFHTVVYQRSSEVIRDWVWQNVNSQHLAHILIRCVDGMSHGVAYAISTAATLAFMAGFVATARRDIDPARRFCWLSAIATMLVPTAWPHYFVFLPLTLAITWSAARARIDRTLWWAGLALSSVPLVFVFGWNLYVRAGALAMANLLLVVLLWRTVPRSDMVE